MLDVARQANNESRNDFIEPARSNADMLSTAMRDGLNSSMSCSICKRTEDAIAAQTAASLQRRA